MVWPERGGDYTTACNSLRTWVSFDCSVQPQTCHYLLLINGLFLVLLRHHFQITITTINHDERRSKGRSFRS